MKALCAHSWGLKEGQQLDGDEKRQSNYLLLLRLKKIGAEEREKRGRQAS